MCITYSYNLHINCILQRKQEEVNSLYYNINSVYYIHVHI